MFLSFSDYASFPHFWTRNFLILQMLSLFCFSTVIGGQNVSLRLSLSGECDKKDSFWKILQKEVFYVKLFLVFSLANK